MLRNDNMDFDQQIRSVFENAEEKVPQSVWNAVCSDLDGKYAARGRAWRWAGFALAAAAMLAGAVLLIDGGMPRINQQAAQDLSAEVIVVPDDSKETISQEGIQIAQAPSPVRKSTARVAADAVSARQAERESILSEDTLTPAEAVKPDETATQAGAPSTDGKQAASNCGNTSPSKTGSLMMDDWVDDDIPQAGRRVSITVNSSVGGNDKDFSSLFGPMKTASSIAFQNRNYIVESGASNFSIPFSAGLGVRFALGGKFSVGSGVSYTYLANTFSGIYYDESGKSSGEVKIGHYMHYLGIPVNAYYDIVSGRRLKFYVYMGGQADFCLANKYQVFNSQSTSLSKPVSSVQWSVGAGLGVEFLLVDKLGIYFDPGARYYFPCNQPKNIHTERPFNINFDIGFRYDF